MKRLLSLLLLSSSGCFFVAQCGDDITQTFNNESCDDGNNIDGDGCSTLCKEEICGDGEQDQAEACDNGSNNSNSTPNACRTDCTLARCGDGVVDNNEACDDGNSINDDDCTNNCALPSCGDGIVQSDEGCDDGNTTGTDGCSSDCVIEFCGDGIINFDLDTGLDECDDADNINTNACRDDCTLPVCGDGLRLDLNNNNNFDPGDEECDDGALNSDIEPDACRTDCLGARCGDGTQDSDEPCEDGNTISGDGCSDICSIERCGDGIQNNSRDLNGDGDTSDAGEIEQCDDSDTENGDGCDNNCTLTACGNGIFTAGELCGFTAPTQVNIGNGPTSIVAADLNGVVGVELAVTSVLNDSVTILQNANGSLAVSQSVTGVEDAPQFIIAADLSVSGASPDVELIVLGAGATNRLRILPNDNGSFNAGSLLNGAGPGVEGVAAPFRVAGELDVVTVDGTGDLHVFTNASTESLTLSANNELSATITTPSAIVAADFNTDGDIDVAVLNRTPGFIIFLLNTGNGTFAPASATQSTLNSATDMVVGNLNSQGNEELVVVNNESNTVQIFALTGTCTTGADCLTLLPSTASSGADAQVVKLGDINNDGSLDVIVANSFGDLVRILFTENNAFSTLPPLDLALPSGAGALDMVLVDLDADNALDIVTANRLSNNVSVFLYQP